MIINSRQNPTIKRLTELREAKGRREQGRFLVDSPREIERALKRGKKILAVYRCEAYNVDGDVIKQLEAINSTHPLPPSPQTREGNISGLRPATLGGKPQTPISVHGQEQWAAAPSSTPLPEGGAKGGSSPRIPIIELGKIAFDAIAYRENPYGLLAEIETWPTNLASLNVKNPTLVIVAEDIEKPGNLGTLMRTADAVGADAIIGCNPTVDLFNPNTLRASAGAAFSVPYATATLVETLAWLKENKLKLVATSPATKKLYWETDLRKPCALAVGSEAWGLSEEMLKAADETVSLPMKGVGDSLNVSVATGAILYEILRQRSGM